MIPAADSAAASLVPVAPEVDARHAQNLAALTAHQPEFAAILRSTAPPADAVLTRGRDGEPTYAWTDSAGRRAWLGRATTPRLRGPALIEAFQPGDGNILLLGLGHGIEARLLIDRLARHQAIFVVEPEPGHAALALRLHDFSTAIAEGRLVFCAGPDPWSSLEDYLIRHPGYLVPERVLCMPWFDGATVADISGRLNALSAAVARQRNDATVNIPASTTGSINSVRLAVVTNLNDPAALRLAENLAAAAAELGWSCVCCVPDSPRWMHPAAVSAGLSKFAPDLTLVLGASPATLAFALPAACTAIVCLHGLGLTRDWIESVPRSATIIARSPEQRGQLAAAGIDDNRLLFWPPAARGPRGDVANRAAPPFADAPILVFCDAIDASPDAAGLNLDSHRRLWAAAERLLRDRADAYHDDDARRICDAAAKSLGMDLKSPEVIDGLTLRIRALLGPAVVRTEYLKALLKAGIDFRIVGGGRFADKSLSERQISPWPAPLRDADLLRDHVAAVTLETGDAIPDGWLDCAAAGMALLFRRAGHSTVPASFGGIEGVWSHVSAFQTRDELVRLARQLRRAGPVSPVPAATAAGLIQSAHLWKHRLLSLNELNGR